MMHQVILDGDFGADELHEAAVLAARPDAVRVIGALATFGNAPLAAVSQNALRGLAFVGLGAVPVHRGAEGPLNGPPPNGDGAHGADGIGGISLPEPTRMLEPGDGIDWLASVLGKAAPGSVTLLATGPLTSLAKLLHRAPEARHAIDRVIVMGGATAAMPAADRPGRQGNITQFAEFNFFMDPDAAEMVLSSGLEVALMPLNATHQLTATPDRLADLAAADLPEAEIRRLQALVTVPEEIEQEKFGIHAVLHDVHTALFLLYPELYQGRRGWVRVTLTGEEKGRSIFAPDEAGPVTVIEQVIDPDRAWALTREALVGARQQAGAA